MKVYSKGDDMSECKSGYGNSYFTLTRDEVMALLNGFVLADPDWDEYGTFISMEEGES